MLNAQTVSRKNIAFSAQGNPLSMPLVGGLNAPQFSEVDLNNDGTLDLYVFDRIGNVSMTFINEGIPFSSSYQYAPEYLVNFPDSITNFASIKDYNGDGIGDLFCYSLRPGIIGIGVYTGYFDSANRLAFELFKDVIFFPGSSNGLPTNLPLLNIDIPAIDDFDCDGDLDIITFEISGGTVDLFRNFSVENGFGLDSLIFRYEQNCWGGFYESGFTTEIILAETQGDCAVNVQNEESNTSFRHAGSTILSIDLNNDDSKELILGDISFPSLTMLTNEEGCGGDFMIEQDNNFPSYDSSVDIPVFPAAFALDVNNDGLKDMIAAPNNNGTSEDQQNVWYYQNTNSNEYPVFQLQQRNFLVNKMIDLGTTSCPEFADVNQDGLYDLIVGTDGAYQPFGEKDPRLYLFLNTGTATNPEFELEDDDWLDFSQYGANNYSFSPCFGDLDNDGDEDLMVGEQWGSLFYLENVAGEGNPMSFATVTPADFGIDVGLISRPCLADINNDGKLDLIIGERNGNINYFENYGTTNEPLFYAKSDTLNNNPFFGEIDTRRPGYATGYSAPTIIRNQNEDLLITGSESGKIQSYIFELFELNDLPTVENKDYGSIRDGFNSEIALADIDNDNLLEMMVGNQRGGLTAYDTNLPAENTVSTSSVFEVKDLFEVYPNPASDKVTIELNNTNSDLVDITIYNQMGQKMIHLQTQNTTYPLATNQFAKGIYFIQIRINNQIQTQKLLIQ